MNFFKKLKALRDNDAAATRNSKAVLEETLRTEPEVDREHEVALAHLRRATEQARHLRATDEQNHYSESLTHSFRGRPAT